MRDDYIIWEIFEKERLFHLLLFAPLFGIPLTSPIFMLQLLPSIKGELEKIFLHELNREEALSRILSRFQIE